MLSRKIKMEERRHLKYKMERITIKIGVGGRGKKMDLKKMRVSMWLRRL